MSPKLLTAFSAMSACDGIRERRSRLSLMYEAHVRDVFWLTGIVMVSRYVRVIRC